MGRTIAAPLLHAVTLFSLLFVAFILALPETVNAQIWVSSLFILTPGAQTETAACGTYAIDPTTGATLASAADYDTFLASCSVTPSDGTPVITSAQCPGGANGSALNFPSGNPLGMCAITFQPKNDVTYTLNSTHALTFNVDPYGTQCGQYDYSVCLSDPLGYYSMSPGAADPWPPMPTFPTDTASIEVDESCTQRGGTCTPQDIPSEYCGSTVTIFGITICTGTIIGAPPFWDLAQTSAQFSCNLPTNETTAFQGWDNADTQPSLGLWEQTDTDTNGDSFSGYQVQETSPTVGVDTCYFYDPNLPGNAPTTGITGGNWTIGNNNTWGPDKVGWKTAGVAYFRANNRVPCHATVYQQMQFYCTADNFWHNYGPVNTLQITITATTVSSERAGVTDTRRY